MSRDRKEERKQMEEEKRRVKRDRILLEKAQREKSKGDERRVAEDVENLQTKVHGCFFFSPY